jgi:hypothetical protein
VIALKERRMTSKEEILEFLREFKQRMDADGLQIIPRKKTRDQLAYFNLVQFQVAALVSKLTLDNFIEGPLPDHDGSEGTICAFALEYDNQTIYVKLKLDQEAKCLSFHRAEYPVKFPFRED